MTYDSFDGALWPLFFIAVAGWLATDLWRWLGVLLGNRISETSDALVLVRAIATALVAAVIARLILFPTGALAETSMALRLFAAVAGFAGFQLARQKVIVGVTAALSVLMIGVAAGF